MSPFGLARRASTQTTPRTDHEMQLGADFRLGLGSATTLSGTVLPDFGQVEADPAVLNLTVFETFYPERRTFFLEDGNIFVPPYFFFRLFHSRRIGRPPGYVGIPPGELALDRPEQTSLLGAAKVTARGSGWTYGALGAITGSEYATVERAAAEGGDMERVRRLIEPMTSYNAVRVQRDVGASSNIGWIGTAVLRDGAPDAFTTGVDYSLRWDRNRWYFNGHWAGSRAPLTSRIKSDFGGVTNIGYVRKHYNFAGHVDHFGRNFSINDMGILRTRNDRTAVTGSAGLSQPDPWGVFRNVAGSLFAAHGQNGTGLVFARDLELRLNGRFVNFWPFEFTAGMSPRLLDDLDTRGGPPIIRPPRRWLVGFLGTDTRKRWHANANLFAESDDEGGYRRNAALSLRLNPSARFQSTTAISYRREYAVAQWIRNLDATGDGELDHVYGSLNSRVADITVRGTFALHPDLTLELFTQPFVAVGDYSDFRRLARPSSFDFEPVALAFNPDFNRKELLGNAVLRWEYRPGSTLFLVWNATGRDLERPGDFNLRRDLADAFSAPRGNVFMLKATYWLAW